MLYLHTLGDALIKVGEKEIRPTAPLVFAALLYLGMERGRRVPRAALQELLFPNANERSGAHSLRQLLYKLRQLGAPIEADGSSVLVPADLICDDTAELNLTNGHGDNAERYALGFLPDYVPRLSERFDEWIEQRRAFVGAEIRRQLITAMGSSRESVNWSAVERYAQLILGIDAFNEEATLALAEASALSGAKVEALTILTRYENETGRRDLKLPAALLRQRISEQIPDKRRAFDTPFVGREADVNAVRHELLQARRGNPSIVVIAGEAGIGKTRLLDETMALASLEGFHIQRVCCAPHHGSRPLGVFIDLVPALLNCRGALGVSPQSLAYLNLLISHADDRGDRPTDARDDVTRSSVLLRAVRDLIDSVAAETSLVLAIEDAQWADADSLRELNSFVHSLSGRALLVIYTARSIEMSHLVLLGDSVHVRRLKPLAVEPMAELARHLLSRKHGSRTVEDIVTWSVKTASGNPLFLQMLCSYYEETGQAFAVPPDVISATRQRIETLPQTCRRILELCTLLGRHSTLGALRSLAECTDLQLLDSAQRLEEEGFLFLEGNTARVSHDLLGECTLGLVPAFSRTVLHSMVAANLERRYDTTHDASLLWDCAEHWSLSGENDKALHFLTRCAIHAAHIGRAAQALAILGRAREIANCTKDQAMVLGEMMLAARAAGDWSEVYELSEQLSLVTSGVADEPRHTHQELLALESRFAMRMRPGDSEDQLLCCLEALDASAQHRIDAALLLLRMAHEFGDKELASRAYSAVEHLLDPRSKSYSNRVVPVIYHASFGDADRAVPITQSLARDLEAIEPIGDQLRAATNVAVSLSYLGFLEEAIAVTSSYYDKTRVAGMLAWQAQFACQTCVHYVSMSKFAQAERWYERIESLGRHGLDARFGRLLMSAGFEIALWQKNAVLARKILDDLARAATGESVRGKSYLRGAEIRLLQLDPNFDCDERTLKELEELYEATKRLIVADGLTCALGEALKRRGRREDLSNLLHDYLRSSRRDRTPVPPQFDSLIDYCGYDSALDHVYQE